MTSLRSLYDQITGAGVTLHIEFDEGTVRCTPTRMLTPDLVTGLRQNLRAVAVWHALSQVIDPARLGVILDWIAGHEPGLYETEEEAGLRLAAAWPEDRRRPFFRALERWVAILSQSSSDARKEPGALEGKIPIWCWRLRYTARGAPQKSPLSELFAVEVGLPDDDEAGVVGARLKEPEKTA